VLVGFETSDDAGIFQLNPDQAIVSTVDFITPPVDDPFLFGQIAAANSLSDVYAMGGTPFACLNLVCFPSDKLGPEILEGILAGAMDRIQSAGAVLLGGHSTEDEEPKFGMAVNGLVHPQKIWKNVGALAGDQLILTKPLGSGVLFNANLKGWVSGKALDECIRQLVELNKTSAEILKKYQVHAVTDITGFGLAGHGLEMARGSGVSIQINVENLPVFDEAFQMYEKGVSTGVNSSNRKLVENHIHYQDFLPAFKQEILFDPQTSGGLLASVAQHQSEEILRELHHSGMVEARVIGNVHPFEKNHINFT